MNQAERQKLAAKAVATLDKLQTRPENLEIHVRAGLAYALLEIVHRELYGNRRLSRQSRLQLAALCREVHAGVVQIMSIAQDAGAVTVEEGAALIAQLELLSQTRGQARGAGHGR